MATGTKKPETTASTNADAKAQLESFLAKFSPNIAAEARTVLKRMRALYPNALELVYDNYNALAIGFGPTERASDAIFSIALYPKWVSLFFLQGKGLPDPEKLLKGSGNAVRHIVLSTPETLDQPAVRELMREAEARARVPFDAKTKRRLIIKSVSDKQRSRRPAMATAR